VKIINTEFPQEQHNRYFQHQLTDLGYYAEVIIKLKSGKKTYPAGEYYSDYETNNFLNKDIFKAYNIFYDNITDLTIEDDYKGPDLVNQNNSRTFVSYEDICPKRINKPAVEGGILRNIIFQNKLLKNEVFYLKNDPGALIIDGDIGDGTSSNFVFGKMRRQNCNLDSQENKCFITHFGQIRNRFDLLSTTEKERYLSVKFLKEFANHLSKLQSDIFDFSFHTSHTLEDEIVKYSIYDSRFVIIALILFWLVFFVLMSFDIDSLSYKVIRHEINQFRQNIKANSVCYEMTRFFLHFWLNGSGFIVMITFIQFILTLTSTVGFLSLLQVPINQLLYTIAFALMINSCHQSLLLYKNFKRVNLKSDDHANNKYSCDYNKYTMSTLLSTTKQPDSSENNEKIEIELKFAKLIHKILIPNFIILISTVIIYLVIGLTSAFEAISVYCLFISVSFCFNFLGQICFFCPCLVLHMKSVARNKKNIFCCIYRSERVVNKSKPNTSYTNLNLNSPSPTDLPDSTDTPDTVQNQAEKNDESCSLFRKILQNWSFYKFNLLYTTKFKYVILALFSAYMVANMFVCGFQLKIDIPIKQLLPVQSYLSKHMDFHLTDFELGPMIMLNFLKPIKWTDTNEFNRILQLVADIQKIDGVAMFELNWIKEQFKAQREFANYGLAGLELYQSALDSVKQQANYYDDVFYQTINDTEIVILKNRVYVQMSRFIGSAKELNVMEEINYLAYEVYKYPRAEMIIHSTIYTFLEQMGEIFPSIITLVMILLEGVFLGSLFLVFDLKSIFIEMLVFVSLIFSIFSNLYIFGITLNIVTLYQMVMLPAFLVEFLSYTMYLFLFKTPDMPKPPSIDSKMSSDEQNCKPLIYNNSNKSTSSSSTESINEIRNTEIVISLKAIDALAKTDKKTSISLIETRLKRLQFVLNKNINLTSLYLLFISMFAFSVMGLCDTYNFHTLGLFLVITCINTFFHVHFLYPNLLSLFGTCWMNN